MGIAMVYLVHWFFHPQQYVATIALVWLLGGRGIRGLSHLREHPADLLILPLLALVTVFVALPLKAYAILTMNHQGWLTRHADLIGGEAQGAGTLAEGRTRA